MFTTKYNKSLIQQELERQDVMCCFKEGLDNLMNKYTIEDGVFYLNNTDVREAVSGYFVEDSEYNTLKEALATSKNPVVRIKNNETFVVGSIYENLSKCPTDKKVLDLSTLQYVR